GCRLPRMHARHRPARQEHRPVRLPPVAARIAPGGGMSAADRASAYDHARAVAQGAFEAIAELATSELMQIDPARFGYLRRKLELRQTELKAAADTYWNSVDSVADAKAVAP